MVLRQSLLFLSRRKSLKHWLETSPLASRLTSRFVAGKTLDEGLAVCGRLNRGGILVTLDYLGEEVGTLAEAHASSEACLKSLCRIAELGLKSTISIKLTQFGLNFSEEACRSNVEKVVREAAALDTSVEIDMESSQYVDRTLRLVTEMHALYRNVRGVIQAYLRRSEKDVEMLCARNIPVRLCKGAYNEPPEIAFPNKKEVDANYRRLTIILLNRGIYPALATHDEKMIATAVRHAAATDIPPSQFEFQMLYGIRRDLGRQLVREGYRLRLYVPYGDAWYPYFMRRIAERPANLLFLLRNLARG